jgi:hypothetical protein
MQTFAEVYGLSEDWVKDFFNRPDTYIQQYFGISPCDDNLNCVWILLTVFYGAKGMAGLAQKIKVRYLYL